MSSVQHPAVVRASERLEAAYRALGGGNRWGETRRFAGRSAGLRLERVEAAKKALARAYAKAERDAASAARLDNDRFSAEDQRLYLREPIAFYRGARDCEESTQRNADAGVAFHGLSRTAEAAYRAGWAHVALRRPLSDGSKR